MTERLYYTDAYRTDFEATVLGVDEGGTAIRLDHTAFYPTSGGQPHDLGILGGIPVVEVVDTDDTIVHRLAAPLTGDRVRGTIDWPRRFDFMQQHTGQHLLSAVFADLFGWETVSVHFGADSATLDLSVELVPPDVLRAAAEHANALVVENRPVTVGFEDAATARDLRKPTDRTGPIRVVTIAGLDRSACGGTHVRATGEIGGIVLRRQEKMKRQARIEFLCGHRAMRRARADYELLAQLAAAASASIDELPANVAAQGAELKGVLQARRKLEEEVAGLRAAAAWAALSPDAAGVRWLREVQTEGRPDDVRALAMAFAGRERAVYAARLDATRSLVLAASPDSGLDAGARLREVVQGAGGKGGGSPRFAQGTLPDSAALERAWAALASMTEGA